MSKETPNADTAKIIATLEHRTLTLTINAAMAFSVIAALETLCVMIDQMAQPTEHDQLAAKQARLALKEISGQTMAQQRKQFEENQRAI